MDFETILATLVLNLFLLTLLRLFENRSVQIVMHSCTSFGTEDYCEEEEEGESQDQVLTPGTGSVAPLTEVVAPVVCGDPKPNEH